MAGGRPACTWACASRRTPPTSCVHCCLAAAGVQGVCGVCSAAERFRASRHRSALTAGSLQCTRSATYQLFTCSIPTSKVVSSMAVFVFVDFLWKKHVVFARRYGGGKLSSVTMQCVRAGAIKFYKTNICCVGCGFVPWLSSISSMDSGADVVKLCSCVRDPAGWCQHFASEMHLVLCRGVHVTAMRDHFFDS